MSLASSIASREVDERGWEKTRGDCRQSGMQATHASRWREGEGRARGLSGAVDAPVIVLEMPIFGSGLVVKSAIRGTNLWSGIQLICPGVRGSVARG